MRIEQVYFSNSVKFFKDAFLSRWGMIEYHDKTKPALFFGVYGLEDVAAINSHEGFTLIWNAGTTRDCFSLIDPSKVTVWVGNGIPFYDPRYKMKHVNIQIKDFTMFDATPLGDKVYWYMGNKALQWMYSYELYEKIVHRCNYEIILGYLGNPIEWIKANCYDKSFVNIKPAIVEGYTTSTEMAFMGRHSIGRGQNHWNIPFKDADELLRAIDTEAKKIGTIQPSLIGDYFTKNDWQNVNFWL
jgi:hypothetical protein